MTAAATAASPEARREEMFAAMRARMAAAERAAAEREEARRAQEMRRQAEAREAAARRAREAEVRRRECEAKRQREREAEREAKGAADGAGKLPSRGRALALATPACRICLGAGLVVLRNKERYCGCVLRCISRQCIGKYNDYQERPRWTSRACLDMTRWTRTPKRWTWGRPDEEYCADLYLIARRTLSGWEWNLFRWHLLAQMTWQECCPRLRIDRGNFFHAVYRVEAKLGLAFLETRPYAIYPFAEYFGAVQR